MNISRNYTYTKKFVSGPHKDNETKSKITMFTVYSEISGYFLPLVEFIKQV